MTALDTEIAVVGSGAGGATTAAVLAGAGRDVVVIEEGPRLEPGSFEPFSIEELAAAYRHRGSSAALGSPPIAYAEGRCVGGSTEVNSGLWHRLPAELADGWRRRYDIVEFEPDVLDRYAAQVEARIDVSCVSGPLPPSSQALQRGATALGWRSEEFPRAFRYDERGRGTKQTMTRTLIPQALGSGARLIADCRASRLLRHGNRVVGVEGHRQFPGGPQEAVTVHAEHVVVCGGAIQTPALLQRSGLRAGLGRGLKVHPTVKVVARFPEELDHDDVPMARITEFAPAVALGGSASRLGHLGLALADAGVPVEPLLDDWKQRFVYYASIRSDAGGRVVALPGMASPLVTYRLTDGDLSRLARGLVHLGEALLAAGATELHASLTGAPVARRLTDLAGWWEAVDRRRANLMTVHLTSSIRMGEDEERTAADSFGRVRGVTNLRVSDASLLPEAPGVNPQAAIMTVAARNADHLLATT